MFGTALHELHREVKPNTYPFAGIYQEVPQTLFKLRLSKLYGLPQYRRVEITFLELPI